MRNLSFGLQPDRPCVACWGARAIYHTAGGYVDILWDRQDAVGDRDHVKSVCAWFNEFGRAMLQAKIEETELPTYSCTGVEIEAGSMRLIASPRGSYGYLYLCAMLLDTPAKS